jgi:hypothetical protein
MPHCELCGRDQPLTFHHLIPKAVHSKKKFQKRFTKEQMQEGIDICRKCHSGIHDIIEDEKELADKYYTKALLLEHEGIVKHVAWVRKQK